jgi:hypothetical protein
LEINLGFFYAGRLVSSPGASVNDFQPDEQVPCVQLQQVCSASKFIRIHFGLLDPDPEKSEDLSAGCSLSRNGDLFCS